LTTPHPSLLLVSFLVVFSAERIFPPINLHLPDYVRCSLPLRPIGVFFHDFLRRTPPCPVVLPPSPMIAPHSAPIDVAPSGFAGVFSPFSVVGELFFGVVFMT